MHRLGKISPTGVQLCVSTLTLLIHLACWTNLAAAQAVEPSASRLAELQAPFRRPSPMPDLKPLSAIVSAGRALFYDATLSADGTMACASCHHQDKAWRDGRMKPLDRFGAALPRHVPTLLNLAWAPLLTWDGRMDSLEQQALDPIVNGRMGALPLDVARARVEQRLAGDAGFAATYRDAFGDLVVTNDRIAGAIAAFERSLVSPLAPFDRWIEGDQAAVSPAAKRGFLLFTGSARCSNCHSGWRLTDDGFHDVGLPDADLGRGARFPAEPTLQHAFKTPTLRNVAVVGPYMHDGSLPTLDRVLAHYDGGFVRRPSLDPDMQPLALRPSERADLLAFLESLTSPELAP